MEWIDRKISRLKILYKPFNLHKNFFTKRCRAAGLPTILLGYRKFSHPNFNTTVIEK